MFWKILFIDPKASLGLKEEIQDKLIASRITERCFESAESERERCGSCEYAVRRGSACVCVLATIGNSSTLEGYCKGKCWIEVRAGGIFFRKSSFVLANEICQLLAQNGAVSYEELQSKLRKANESPTGDG